MVALDEASGAVQAVGERARRMIGRTPATISAVRPLRHGVIADFEVTRAMLRHFLRASMRNRLSRPRVVLCVPSGVTPVERRAVEQAVLSAGARAAYLIEEALAGAIGAGLPVAEPAGSFVVDIGGGTTEIAVISLGGIVVSRSLRVGGYDMDDAIVRHLKEQHRLLVGQEKAEEVKLAIGSAFPGSLDGEATIAGRDLATGLLRRAVLDAEEVRQALAAAVQQIADSVVETLEQTPPELAADITTRGITMVGGGALLRGIEQHLHQHTRLPVTIAPEPLTCVAIGAGTSLDELDTLERVSSGRRSARAPRRDKRNRR